MNMDKIKAYFDHFLPREIIGPVIIVFSLEGVISGIFAMYVPQSYETVAWLIIFLISVIVVARWGTSGEASEDLEELIDSFK